MSNVINVILHLKCSMDDVDKYEHDIQESMMSTLAYNPKLPFSIESYNEEEMNSFGGYDRDDELEDDENRDKNKNHKNMNMAEKDGEGDAMFRENDSNASNFICSVCERDKSRKDLRMQEIKKKMNKLKVKIYKNTISKKSNCFWCTFDFDNDVCYIPKYNMTKTIECYGCFCCPECAVAFLMKECIDDSVKLERFHLLEI